MENKELTPEQKQAVLDMQVVTKVGVICQMNKIIEGCCQRGAFKSEEMTYIGGIYDALSKVVKDSVAKVVKEESEKTEETKEKIVEIAEETTVDVKEKTVEGEEEKL